MEEDKRPTMSATERRRNWLFRASVSIISAMGKYLKGVRYRKTPGFSIMSYRMDSMKVIKTIDIVSFCAVLGFFTSVAVKIPMKKKRIMMMNMLKVSFITRS